MRLWGWTSWSCLFHIVKTTSARFQTAAWIFSIFRAKLRQIGCPRLCVIGGRSCEMAGSSVAICSGCRNGVRRHFRSAFCLDRLTAMVQMACGGSGSIGSCGNWPRQSPQLRNSQRRKASYSQIAARRAWRSYCFRCTVPSDFGQGQYVCNTGATKIPRSRLLAGSLA